jgi:superfamily I DNA/RNA helicase
MTRARRQLYLLRARRRLRGAELVETEPSRFLAPLAALPAATVTYLEPEGPRRAKVQQLSLL